MNQTEASLTKRTSSKRTPVKTKSHDNSWLFLLIVSFVAPIWPQKLQERFTNRLISAANFLSHFRASIAGIFVSRFSLFALRCV